MRRSLGKSGAGQWRGLDEVRTLLITMIGMKNDSSSRGFHEAHAHDPNFLSRRPMSLEFNNLQSLSLFMNS
jgi:hypothetical protein